MITQGYLARHFQGRSGMRDPALLDVAQDYALKHLHDQGAFEVGIVLKGGTSLRKLRAGNAGRFSTDLDFATPDLGTAEFLLDTLDGAELFDVRFSLDEREATRAKLIVDTPLGRPAIPARIEISPRRLWLPTKLSAPIALAVHSGYEFTPPAIPAPAMEESLAEKLAAWRRRRKLRDLYDLDLFGRGALNEKQIRRLLVLKVWHDIVDDGLGQRPFDPAEIIADTDVKSLPPEDIGLLTRPIEPEVWAQQRPCALRLRHRARRYRATRGPMQSRRPIRGVAAGARSHGQQVTACHKARMSPFPPTLIASATSTRSAVVLNGGARVRTFVRTR